MPISSGNTLLVELRPILHIHLHPQISKRLHPRSHLGRVDHPERIKYLSQTLGAEPANVQGIADPGTVGAERRFGFAVFILAAAQRDRLGCRLADPVHAQVPIIGIVLQRLTRVSQFCFSSRAAPSRGTRPTCTISDFLNRLNPDTTPGVPRPLG